MNIINSTITTADSIVARAEQKHDQAELENAQMLRSHFDEQIAEARRRAPRCENSRGGHAPTYEDAEECGASALDVCVHCEAALCSECISGPCTEAPGKHLPSRKAIEQAVAKLADKMRMAG